MTGSAGAVRARVRAAQRALALARAAECALLALAALCATLAVAVGDGASAGRAETWVVAVLCAALAAGTWWGEHRPRPARVARAIDARLGLGGGFATAFEAEAARPEAPLVLALSRRVAGRVSARDALQAILPRTLPLVALPFLAAGWLALSLERASTAPASVARLAGRAAGELGRIAAGVGDPDAEPALTPEELEAFAALAERVEGLSGAAVGRDREAAARELDEIEAELAALGRSVPVDPLVARALERAGADLVATRRALGAERSTGPSVRPPEGPRESGVGGAAGGDGGRRVPSEAGDGMMSALDSARDDPGAPLAGDAGERSGLVLGPTPPERYAAIIARWIEARRGAGAPR